MFLALVLYVAQLKCLSGVSSPHEKTMTGQKHLFLLLITDADYLFTAPLRRPQLCFASFIHKQWSHHDPPRLILYTLCRRPDFYRLQTNGLNSIHKVNWLYLQQLQR